MPVFEQSSLEAIAAALGHTEEGLTGSEIGHLLATCRMQDPDPSSTKWIRLYNAFAESQNRREDRGAILKFIRQSMKPERYARNPERFEPMRANLNKALSFDGHAVDESGTLVRVKRARTLSDAERRANGLRADLSARGVHEDVLNFCRAELVEDNYFHAVLEAAKSIAAKLRQKTGLTDDGVSLVDQTLGGNPPMLAINSLRSRSEKSEQSGFANLVKGVFGMFRNPTAHEARIHWSINKSDAEDLLCLASLIHRRLDNARMPPQA